jgi:hypothetical protein
VVVLGVALVLSAAALDLLVTGHLGVLFDVCFVLACLAVALLVHPRDFFVVGLLPPLVMTGAFLLLALSRVDAIARSDDGVVQAVVTGLGRHSIALFVGYGLTLACLGMRRRRSAAAAEL